MKLSKKTRLLGLNIVNYTQYLCDQLDDNDPTDQIAKIRCKNALNQISRNITVIPKGKIHPTTKIIYTDITVLRYFIKTATREIQKPTLKNVSLFRDKKEFQHDASLLVNTFEEILDTLLWYCKEKEIETPE